MTESALKLKLVLAMIVVAFTPFTGATEKEAPFEGIISATLTRGGTDATALVFTRKGTLLRIQNTTNKLEPVNIVDLAANKLTIVYPHNTTFVQIDLTKKQANPGMPGMPNSLGGGAPGVPNSPPMGAGAAGFPGTTNPNASQSEAATGGGQPGPKISPPPGFPTPPSMPAMPGMPNNPMAGAAPGRPMMPGAGGGMPNMPGAGMGAAGMPGMPSMPGAGGGMPGMAGAGGGMPAMPPMGGFGPAIELKKGDKIKKIQGLDCALYTVTGRMEKFEIWATNDSSLFPFRSIERNYIGRRFGPQMLEEQWIELLRDKSLFPLEATLRMEGSDREQFSFKIDKIDQKKIADDALFKPPGNYQEIQAPQF